MDEVSIVFEFFKEANEPGIMLDVGAHYGSSSLPFLRANWEVYAFEPDPDNYERLSENLGSYKGASLNNIAVSNEDCTSRPFYSSTESSGLSSLASFHSSHKYRCTTETVTLASFCRNNSIDNVDFLKIDTEGLDLLVLKGMDWELIRPKVIVCEFEDSKTKQLNYSYKDLADYLISKGYKILISEWYPIEQYGIEHQWRRFHTWPCELEDETGWGNIIALSGHFDIQTLFTAIGRYGESRFQAIAKKNEPSPKAFNMDFSRGCTNIVNLARMKAERRLDELNKKQKIENVVLHHFEAWSQDDIDQLFISKGIKVIGAICEEKIPEPNNQSVVGVPRIEVNRLSEVEFDKVVLPFNPLYKIAPLFKGIVKDKTVSLIKKDEFVLLVRLACTFKLGQNDLSGARYLAENLVDISSEQADFELIYRIGLELLKQKKQWDARLVFERVSSSKIAGKNLNAWATFKLGEMQMDLKHISKAKEFFEKTLELDPNHIKAKIYLIKENVPFRVIINQFENKIQGDILYIKMDLFSSFHWNYYFRSKKPSLMDLTLSNDFSLENFSTLMGCIAHYLNDDGCARIHNVQSLDRIFSTYAEAVEIKLENLEQTNESTNDMIVLKKAVL